MYFREAQLHITSYLYFVVIDFNYELCRYLTLFSLVPNLKHHYLSRVVSNIRVHLLQLAMYILTYIHCFYML
jgi:hypothetical protein